MGWKEIVSTFAPIVGGATAGFLSQGENAHARNQADQEMAANIRMQKEFAKNGIRWRVEDAKAAGLHPLAALGASSMGYSPVTSISEPDHSRSDMVRDLGQNISRATMVSATPEEKTYRALQVESLAIDNALKKKELEGLTQPGTPSISSFGSGIIPGQGNSPFSTGVPHRDRPSQEAGYKPDVAYSQGDELAYPYIPTNLSESYESDPIGALLWRIRNTLLPNVSPKSPRPPVSDLPPGKDHWQWNWRQGWKPVSVPSWMKGKLRKKQLQMERRWQNRGG